MSVTERTTPDPGAWKRRAKDDDGHVWVQMEPGRWVSWFDRFRYEPGDGYSTDVLTEKWASINGLRHHPTYRQGADPGYVPDRDVRE